ncbi:flagellar motor switch protein FliG [Legionella sp. CNM-4043-24]|uniref:flagellar motor switch protein FliG n=1 Tax=Legionella sp. CNM-4043-24 TaxID=3421646 RepID=UPI00403B2842
MDSLKNAAIIILGMGEQCAAEVLKNMSHKEVESIIETMNHMGDVSEQEVIVALNAFFNDANNTTGINVSSSEYIRKTFLTAVGSDKAGTIFDEAYLSEELMGVELLKWQPLHVVIDALEEEHPQIITVALMCLDGEKSAQILKWLPSEQSKDVINRMTNLSPVSSYAMKTLSEYLQEQFTKTEKFKLITSDGVDMAANIIAYMDGKEESEIMSFLTNENLDAWQRIQGKLFPFERLARLDSRGMQTVISEISNEDLVLALKGTTDEIRKAFFKCMSSKTVDLLTDDIDSTGPKKMEDLIDAQQRIIDVAKKLAEEQKIILPGLKGSNKVL